MTDHDIDSMRRAVVQVREERDRYRAVLMRISNLENTHESWDDACRDAIDWARKALTTE